ncbi:hypothetical protein SAMN05421638_0529 [Kaistella treverensis]|uniref:Uncharacterized protein n=1 Tax=Kaistella treverensis TaxID=631455 RepID=A0A1I3K138_9FLAO|nr:hypothetical protein [Kaistella treverensis]SFI66239.1 hypothetical protein SAMN05421638_0529 [Kaistella treverensis]
MRLNNRNKAGYFQFLSILVLIILVGGIVLYFIDESNERINLGSVLLLIIPLFFALIFYLRGSQIFEYDSDGEALNFRNRNVVFFLNKAKSDEFPKYKLLDYEIVNLILYKRLYVTISSKKSKSVILKYDISYLSGKELDDLKSSLKKVLSKNKE